MKNLLFSIATFLVFCLLALISLEIGLRIIYSSQMDYQVEMTLYAAQVKRQAASTDIGHEHKPNQKAHLMGVDFQTNSHGFREKPIEMKKDKNTIRIMFLGDSLTVGWGVKQDERFSDLLENKLLKDKIRVETINTGVGNYNTSQEVSFYKLRGHLFKPDIVVLCYFINDAEPTPHKRLPAFIKHSYAAMWLWGRVDTLMRQFGEKKGYRKYYRELYGDDRPGWIKTKESLKALVNMTRREGTKLILVILPELHTVGDKYEFKKVHNKIIKAARKSGIVNIIDTTGAFSGHAPDGLWVAKDDTHPNAKANNIIADKIFKSRVFRAALQR